jgi:NADH-quinone oxidoreductase subunit G
MLAGEKSYDFVEVMACPGGCIAGAGQPFTDEAGKKLRSGGLYEADRMSNIKRAEENPVIMALYGGLLKGKVHKLLHVHYGGKA